MECLFGYLTWKKIKLLLAIIILIVGYYLIFNSYQIHLFNEYNKLQKVQKHSSENASLFISDIGYNLSGSLLPWNKIHKGGISPEIDNKNFTSYDDGKSNPTFEFSNYLRYFEQKQHNRSNQRNEEKEVKKTDKNKSINDVKNRQEIQVRRKLRIAKECEELQIIPEDFSGVDWGRSECHPDVTEKGYKECVDPKHFPLARSSSSMTCIINKVASTSIVTLFLENDGQVIPSLNESSPHEIVTSITATRKEEFLFAQKHFFKFLIVRDPFERLLSAYVDKVVIANHWSLLELRADILKFIVEHKGYLTNKFVKVDSNLGKKDGGETQSAASESQDSYVPSFQEFLEYILNSNLEGYGFESHWVPYWKWCAPCSMKYDFIAKLDSSPSDLEFIWNRMGIHDKKKVPWLNKSFKKKQELEELKTLHYSILSLKTIAEIYKKFSLDYKLFDYDIRDVLLKGNHCIKGNCENIMQTYF